MDIYDADGLLDRDKVLDALEWLISELHKLTTKWQAEADQLNAAARDTTDLAQAWLLAGRADDFTERAGAVNYLAARAMISQHPAGETRDDCP